MPGSPGYLPPTTVHVALRRDQAVTHARNQAGRGPAANPLDPPDQRMPAPIPRPFRRGPRRCLIWPRPGRPLRTAARTARATIAARPPASDGSGCDTSTTWNGFTGARFSSAATGPNRSDAAVGEERATHPTSRMNGSPELAILRRLPPVTSPSAGTTSRAPTRRRARLCCLYCRSGDWPTQ